MSEPNLPQLLGAGLSIISPLITIFVLWKVGVIGKKNGNENSYHGRIKDLEDFKKLAESNHFHELEGLTQTVWQLMKDFDNFRVENEKRISRLENKLFPE